MTLQNWWLRRRDCSQTAFFKELSPEHSCFNFTIYTIILRNDDFLIAQFNHVYTI
jgi:hypothetical protein